MSDSLVQRFLDWVMGPYRPKLDIGAGGLFEPLNVERVLTQYRVEERAKENGRHNIPPTTDVLPDGPQQELIQFIVGRVDTTLAAVRPVLNDLTRQIGQIDLSRHSAAVRDLERVFAGRVNDLVREGTLHVATARGMEAQRKSEYEDFRAINVLTRAPQYPDSRLLLAGIVSALFVLEAGMNTYFFALAHPFGLLGGLALAGLLALADMVISFALGRFATGVNHRHLAVKLGGLIGLIAAVFWVVGYNVAVGHFREATMALPGGDLDDAWARARLTLSETPLGLRQLDSWLLVILGLLFSAGAAADGWSWDDRYPGYGSVHRRLVTAQQELDEAREDVVRRLREVEDESQRGITRSCEGAQKELEALQNRIASRRTLALNALDFMEHLRKSCNSLLFRYRDWNRQVRTTPAPAYFQANWAYATDDTLVASASEEQSLLIEQRALLHAVIDQCAKAHALIADRTATSVHILFDGQDDASAVHQTA